jgi:glycosyltransferase involved in cell wall biosynthesis
MTKKILIISHDKVGRSMAGPGIRYHQMATLLSKHHDVTLAVFNPAYIADIGPTPYKTIDINVSKFTNDFSNFDVIVALWLSDEMIEYAKSKNIVLIFDLYAPVPVEDLVQRVFGDKCTPESDYDYAQMIRNYQHFVNNADYILTSNLNQQDFWMGYAFSSGKISPSSQYSKAMDSYFGVCPMGIDIEEVRNKKINDLLSKKIPQLKKRDFVIVWTGGIWDWFDAKTPIDAINILEKSGLDNIKLVFLGTKHPNDDVPAMAETEVARQHAKKLGLIDKSVFFLDGWLPYKERIGYLTRADVALYAHKPSIESRFSHRTRVLDHILMCMPTIATKGDYFSDYIDQNLLGLSVEPLNSKEMAQAIKKLASNSNLISDIKNNIQIHQKDFEWSSTLRPLVNFIDGKDFKPSPLIRRGPSNNIESTIAPRALTLLKKITPVKVKKIIKRIII